MPRQRNPAKRGTSKKEAVLRWVADAEMKGLTSRESVVGNFPILGFERVLEMGNMVCIMHEAG